jgi:hypothetical protein|tara:strand:- start:802 stop:1008 length:207 start_codon:yes stop_codon:yes gene_type:complete
MNGGENMNREEIEAKKKKLMEHFERMCNSDKTGEIRKEYSFIDHLVLTIDFLEWELKDRVEAELNEYR